MPRTINILPESVANKIAAGEVVQRPSSAVKELIENSIDAHANQIQVIIKEGGKTFIQVIDNGDGMNAEDAAIAFDRHATSKISTETDLENIHTLGFRGEALASIAAISHVELRTRQSSSDVATKVRNEGSIISAITQDSFHVGTSVTVKNIFYNTPARRNFLKSNNTEFRHIFDVVQRFAISHPEFTIQFISDDETIFNLPPVIRSERIKEIFGERVADSLIEFNEESDYVSITGFLGKPDFSRRVRVEQFLYLNNRSILSRSINHAVFQGYENLLERGSFPFFILFLTIDPKKVDVNVHPSKMEVKFADESSIYRFVLSSIRRALSTHDLIPVVGTQVQGSMKSEKDLNIQTKIKSISPQITQWRELFKRDQAKSETGIQSSSKTDHQFVDIDSSIQSKFQDGLIQDQPSFIGTQQANGSVRNQISSVGILLWQLHNKYIIVPIETGMMIVDQHAAHERILYERAVHRFNSNATQSQQLLFPHTIEMNSGDALLVQQLQSMLHNLGFNIKIFGKSTVIVDGVPLDVKPGEEGTILQDIIDLYREDEKKIKLEPRERLAKSFSCKAAIKAGDSLNEEEMRSLLDQLFSSQVPFACPHGRPVMIKFTLSELDKRFGRTS